MVDTTKCTDCDAIEKHWNHHHLNKWGHLFNTSGVRLLSDGPRSADAPTVTQGCFTLHVAYTPEGMYTATLDEIPNRTIVGKTIYGLLQKIGAAIQATEEHSTASIYDDARQDMIPMFRGFVMRSGDGHVGLRRPPRGKFDYKWWIRSAEKQRAFVSVFHRDQTLHEIAVLRRESAPDDPLVQLAILPDRTLAVLAAAECVLTEKLQARKRPPENEGA